MTCHDRVKSDFVRGDKAYLYDSRGRRYVDFEAGIWCTALGHNHPRLNRVIRKQLDRIVHLNNRFTGTIAEEAAVALLNTANLPDGKCVFLSSGSEAVEFGLQWSGRLTGKPFFLTLTDAYLAAYGLAGSRRTDQWITVDWKDCITCPHPWECRACPRLKSLPVKKIGAFVLESGSSSGSVKFPPNPLVERLAAVIQQHGGLLVVDEVTTGIGRTGKWFGFDHYDVRPDIIAVGKGIGNGYPVSAVILTREVANRIEQTGIRYAQSHQNDPLGCTIAREVITIIREEALVERSRNLGKRFLDRLRLMGAQVEDIKEIRGRGLMIGMELKKGDGRLTASDIIHRLMDHGDLAGYQPHTNTIRFLPALTIEEKDMTSLVENLARILAR